MELEFISVVHDALVFLNNVQNPVTGLTQKQLRDIYTGKISSWEKVGGEDGKIIPFQRQGGSGSQTLFDKLLMGKVAPWFARKPIGPPEWACWWTRCPTLYRAYRGNVQAPLCRPCAGLPLLRYIHGGQNDSMYDGQGLIML